MVSFSFNDGEEDGRRGPDRDRDLRVRDRRHREAVRRVEVLRATRTPWAGVREDLPFPPDRSLRDARVRRHNSRYVRRSPSAAPGESHGVHGCSWG